MAMKITEKLFGIGYGPETAKENYVTPEHKRKRANKETSKQHFK